MQVIRTIGNPIGPGNGGLGRTNIVAGIGRGGRAAADAWAVSCAVAESIGEIGCDLRSGYKWRGGQEKRKTNSKVEDSFHGVLMFGFAIDVHWPILKSFFYVKVGIRLR